MRAIATMITGILDTSGHLLAEKQLWLSHSGWHIHDSFGRISAESTYLAYTRPLAIHTVAHDELLNTRGSAMPLWGVSCPTRLTRAHCRRSTSAARTSESLTTGCTHGVLYQIVGLRTWEGRGQMPTYTIGYYVRIYRHLGTYHHVAVVRCASMCYAVRLLSHYTTQLAISTSNKCLLKMGYCWL